MAKGSIAKQNIENELKTYFGDRFIGIYDKKLYIWAQENGERIQIAISLTCPKVSVAELTQPASGDYNFEDDTISIKSATSSFEPATITNAERERVNDLIKKLGL